MASMAPLCVVRGSINQDEYFHVHNIARPGETISSIRYESRIGGKGANQAIAISRANQHSPSSSQSGKRRVQFHGTIGPDGLWIKNKVKSVYGLESDGILVAEEPTGRAIIQVARDGENSIVLFPGANHSRLHEWQSSSSPSSLANLHPTHILLQNEIDFDSTVQAMKLGRDRSITVVFNPSPLPTSTQLCEEIPWDCISWLVVNQGEAHDLLRALSPHQAEDLASLPPTATTTTTTTTTTTAAEGVDSASAILHYLASVKKLHGVSIVCTLGAKGVLAHFAPSAASNDADASRARSHPGTLVYVPAGRVVGSVKDTTGAGDCFTGYFVHGLMVESEEKGSGLRNYIADQVLPRCVQAAAMCVEKRGTIDSIPFRYEVEERFKQIREGLL